MLVERNCVRNLMKFIEFMMKILIMMMLSFLAENLKTLFRPCAMVVPGIELICEIMLVAEGFQSARVLARKFITLYTLCKELLSHQDHYDWGLRAVKSVLVVAGTLKVRLNKCRK